MAEPLHLNAILNSIRSTVDGGWRISFDVCQTDGESAVKLNELRNQMLSLVIVDQNECTNITATKQSTISVE